MTRIAKCGGDNMTVWIDGGVCGGIRAVAPLAIKITAPIATARHQVLHGWLHRERAFLLALGASLRLVVVVGDVPATSNRACTDDLEHGARRDSCDVA